MKTLTIHPELRSLLPPLTKAEYAGLEADILKDGCRSAIAVWGETVVDGHNRYEICQRHGLPFATTALEFASLDEAKFWAWRHQEHRRNLNPYQRTELALKFKPLLEKEAVENKRSAGGDKKSASAKSLQQNSAEAISEKNTRSELAKLANVSHDTVSRVEFLDRHADEDTKDELRRGDTSINKEYRRVKREIDHDEYLAPLRPDDPDSPLVKKVARRVKLQHISTHDPDTLIRTVQRVFRLPFRQQLIPGLLARMLEQDGEDAVRQTLQTIKNDFEPFF